MEGQREYRVPCSYIALDLLSSLSLAFSASCPNSTIENLSHINIGDATKIDEYVPTIWAISRVKLKSLRRLSQIDLELKNGKEIG